ncbi:MAG: hypothetical protein AUI36_27895 [Cyanobacteria bacterium 13_1_40CM_2_61_4]|nr:MAG: hypothetical protein AUI36_27895 [Cyanobacteria bacterium 13_1_40CM_2_61_4]
MHPGNPSWELFDGQAPIFERRAGLPVQCCRDIAEAISETGDVQPGDLIVEIGPGTGQVGQWLAESARYTGLDLSAGMLQQFHHRLVSGAGNHALIRADCNQSWPLAAGSARVVFSSRAMHLLNHEHVALEIFRIAAPGGATLVLGRVERTSDSIRTRMAHEMIERLRRHGFHGRRGERQNQKLIEACCQKGARRLAPIPVASWKVSTSPRQSLDSWRCLKGLGGIPVPIETRDEILNELAAWAKEEFGGLDRESESKETYVLTPLRLAASF